MAYSKYKNIQTFIDEITLVKSDKIWGKEFQITIHNHES